MSQKSDLYQEDALLHQLQEGNPAAFNKVIYHYGSNMSIAAYAFLKDVDFANRIIRDLFLRLQTEHYKYAVVPLRSYLFAEVQAACEAFIGKIRREQRIYKA
jgi:hypothetical protein